MTRATILADGIQIERSLMYQGMTALALAIMSDTPFLPRSLRQDLRNMQANAQSAFDIFSRPDGDVALFNDSWIGEAATHKTVSPLDELHLLPEGGYARLSRRGDICILDAGAIGPEWNPWHGNSDFLAI